MTRANQYPSIETLHRMLICDADAGRLYWRERTPDLFSGTIARSPEHACANWNARFAGKEALKRGGTKGYLRVGLMNKAYLIHRVIWAMSSGAWPVCEIDHINGNKKDNRLENLRDVSHAENGRNQKLPKSSASGLVGVNYRPQKNVWVARIRVDGTTLNMGTFKSKDDAAAARKNAEIKFGFHPNHGRSWS